MPKVGWRAGAAACAVAVSATIGLAINLFTSDPSWGWGAGVIATVLIGALVAVLTTALEDRRASAAQAADNAQQSPEDTGADHHALVRPASAHVVRSTVIIGDGNRISRSGGVILSAVLVVGLLVAAVLVVLRSGPPTVYSASPGLAEGTATSTTRDSPFPPTPATLGATPATAKGWCTLPKQACIGQFSHSLPAGWAARPAKIDGRWHRGSITLGGCAGALSAGTIRAEGKYDLLRFFFAIDDDWDGPGEARITVLVDGTPALYSSTNPAEPGKLIAVPITDASVIKVSISWSGRPGTCEERMIALGEIRLESMA